MAKIRFSYHRGAIFEGATARPKEAENRTKMVQKCSQNVFKKAFEITFKNGSQKRAFLKPTWHPKGSQDGFSNRPLSDPDGIKNRIDSYIFRRNGPDATETPQKTHFGAQMDQIGSHLHGDPKRCKIGQKIETQRFVPDASGTNRCVSNTRLQNGCSMAAKEDLFHLSDFRRDCFPFCFRSLNSASRLLAVKGFF